ncbi:MAG: RagB/SusD family nutrient uptake outer membrane protein [Bacteroidota bacterium]
MKRYSLLLVLVIGLVAPIFTPSCTNLEEEVFSELTDANFPSSRAELIAGFGAAYANLYSFGSHNTYLSAQEVSSDEMMIPQRGGDWFDGGIWLRCHRHEMLSTDGYIDNAWNDMYRGVGFSNNLIQIFKGLIGDPESPVTDEEASLFVAELRGLRALYYYWLMDMYGNIPLVTDVEAGEALDPVPANNERAEVYAFLVAELEEIRGSLLTGKDANTYARFTQTAADMLLTKLYLNAAVYSGTAQWAQAQTAVDRVISSGLYSLTNDYFENFNADNDNGGVGTSENIFVIPYDAVNAPGFNLPQMTLHYSSNATFDLQEQPWNGYCSLQEFYNSYEDGDARKGVSGNQQVRGNFLAGPQFASDGVTPLTDGAVETADPDGENIIFTPEVNEHFPNALRQAGARVSKYEYEIGNTRHLNSDFPVFRYADALLMKAEALWQQDNGSQEALDLVNQIRTRAGVAELGSLTADELLAERGREMFYEAWRRSDLIRFGKFGDEWDFKPASAAGKELFPIPQNKINVNPNLRQNPSY